MMESCLADDVRLPPDYTAPVSSLTVQRNLVEVEIEWYASSLPGFSPYTETVFMALRL